MHLLAASMLQAELHRSFAAKDAAQDDKLMMLVHNIYGFGSAATDSPIHCK
jgi:hypothetical protein